MNEQEKRGFVLLSVLVLSLVLFSMVSLALMANYRLHSQNKRLSDEARARAAAVRVQPAP